MSLSPRSVSCRASSVMASPEAPASRSTLKQASLRLPCLKRPSSCDIFSATFSMFERSARGVLGSPAGAGRPPWLLCRFARAGACTEARARFGTWARNSPSLDAGRPCSSATASFTAHITWDTDLGCDVTVACSSNQRRSTALEKGARLRSNSASLTHARCSAPSASKATSYLTSPPDWMALGASPCVARSTRHGNVAPPMRPGLEMVTSSPGMSLCPKRLYMVPTRSSSRNVEF
mmetsp:Transcript_25572/g.71643  ORF Transcript_25572/g.71643 Transcript_25572/m.71643 type:complete len:235 (+) Transcript_25572:167-871(+)